MPKSRGRKPKKKRAPASAPKKRLDNFNTTPQELPLSTQPPQEPPLATAPRQEQPAPKIKDREAYNGCCPCGHRDSPVCLCVYIDETMRGHASAGAPRARRFPRARAGERRRLDGRFRLLPGSRGAARPAVDAPHEQISGFSIARWTEGRNVKFDTRWSAGDPARMRRYARQRISRNEEAIRRTIRNPARRQAALLPRHEGRRDGGRGVSQEPIPTQRSHRQRLTELRSDGSYLSTGEVIGLRYLPDW